MVVLSEETFPQASSSSSSSIHEHRYDVFLSFRGADTRNNFTDHLYNALLDAGITTFLDDEEIPTGEQLKPELESAIKASRASIIVLSLNYAFSTWCLDELVLILDRHKKFNQIVIPIFYHVEPTDVRKQQSTFGDAIAKHKQRMKEETDEEKRSQLGQKMELWKQALTQVADLKGKDVKNRKEKEFIEEIVTDVHRTLRVPLISNALPLLIGMDNDIKVITSWLTDGSCHIADILTVLGMSGIGKTSLAKYVFGLCRSTFQENSFLEGISRRCKEQFNGLLDLQKQLYGDISKKIRLRAHDVSEYTSKIENVLARKKVFLVLDDIDSLDQLKALLGEKGFHPGSKIIITTKFGSLTQNYALFNSQVQPKHTKFCLEGLYESKALELLCIHAFKCKKPKVGYEEVSEKLVNYCEGHPLALKVLGESLHNRDVAYWKGCIEGLKKGPDSRIQEALHMSFNSLTSKNDKDLFKHIACFFVGVDRDVTEIILEACDINARCGITNLVDRCLLSIGWNNELMMHQLIQEMGRDLVRQESPNKPWKRSRLWCHEESLKVLKQKKGNGNILGLTLDMRMLEKKSLHGSFELKADALSRMDSLMLLQLNYVHINGLFEKTPEELRWLCMHGFPSKSIVIASEYPLENLVILDMSYSKIESFNISCSNPQHPSRRQKLLGSLKILDLSFCEQLHSLCGFLELPALENLTVKNCISLFEVCESIEQCLDLVVVDLSYCYKLNNLPILIRKLKKVKTLMLDGCNFRESQIGVWDKNSLDAFVADFGVNSQISSSAVTESILRDYMSLTIYLPCSLVSLSLKDNNMSLESFPNSLSSLSMLKYLCLDGNPIISMPDCVRTLPKLETLSMDCCKMLRSIEHPPRSLRNLSFRYLYKGSLLRKVHFDQEMSPLNYSGPFVWELPCSLFEIDGMVKSQLMAGVEEKVLHSLGWTNLKFPKKGPLEFHNNRRKENDSQTQMYYEFGIFSTFYVGEVMPIWIKQRCEGSSISFTVSSSPKKLLGLNFCSVETLLSCGSDYNLPVIKISNITKSQIWIYNHFIDDLLSIDGKSLTYLSHWMFGVNEMESGDHITITVQSRGDDQRTSKCGVRVVFEDGEMEEEKEAEEKDVLGYYKSWNHIIGGDLSAFQTTTGEYILNNNRFHRYCNTISICDGAFVGYPTRYKEDSVSFKAFSQRKSDILDCTSQKVLLKAGSCNLEKNIEFTMDTETHDNAKTKRQRPHDPNCPDKKQRHEDTITKHAA